MSGQMGEKMIARIVACLKKSQLYSTHRTQEGFLQELNSRQLGMQKPHTQPCRLSETVNKQRP